MSVAASVIPRGQNTQTPEVDSKECARGSARRGITPLLYHEPALPVWYQNRKAGLPEIQFVTLYSKPAILPAAPPASQHPSPVVRGYLCLFRGFAGFCPTTHSTWDMGRKSKAQSTKLGDLWHPPLPAVVDPVQNPKKALREAKTAAMEKDPHHASSPRGQRFSIHHTLEGCRRRSKIN